jgi:hypothetical protein
LEKEDRVLIIFSLHRTKGALYKEKESSVCSVPLYDMLRFGKLQPASIMILILKKSCEFPVSVQELKLN